MKQQNNLNKDWLLNKAKQSCFKNIRKNITLSLSIVKSDRPIMVSESVFILKRIVNSEGDFV